MFIFFRLHFFFLQALHKCCRIIVFFSSLHSSVWLFVDVIARLVYHVCVSLYFLFFSVSVRNVLRDFDVVFFLLFWAHFFLCKCTTTVTMNGVCFFFSLVEQQHGLQCKIHFRCDRTEKQYHITMHAYVSVTFKTFNLLILCPWLKFTSNQLNLNIFSFVFSFFIRFKKPVNELVIGIMVFLWQRRKRKKTSQNAFYFLFLHVRFQQGHRKFNVIENVINEEKEKFCST